MAEKVYFQGTCDVCGAVIDLEYNTNEGVIDCKAAPDGRTITWIRHYATAPRGANPDCAIYSSEVVEVSREHVSDFTEDAPSCSSGWERNIFDVFTAKVEK